MVIQTLYGQFAVVTHADATDGICNGSLELISADPAITISDILWSSGQTSAVIADLCPGPYEVSFSANDGCGWSLQKDVIGYGCYINLEVFDASIAKACGSLNSGSITVESKEFFGPYIYTWFKLADQSFLLHGKKIENLASGTYNLEVTHQYMPDCIWTESYFVSDSVTICSISDGVDLIMKCNNVIDFQELNTWLSDHASISVNDCNQASWSHEFLIPFPSTCPGDSMHIPVRFTASNACGVTQSVTRKIILLNECIYNNYTVTQGAGVSEMYNCPSPRFLMYYRNGYYSLGGSPVSWIIGGDLIQVVSGTSTYDYFNVQSTEADGSYAVLSYCGSCDNYIDDAHFIINRDCSLSSAGLWQGVATSCDYLLFAGGRDACAGSNAQLFNFYHNDQLIQSGTSKSFCIDDLGNGNYRVDIECANGDGGICLESAYHYVGGQCDGINFSLSGSGSMIEAINISGCANNINVDFYLSSQLVQSGSNLSYTPTQNGTYTVKLSCDNCVDVAEETIDVDWVCSQISIQQPSALYDGVNISMLNKVTGCNSGHGTFYTYYLNGDPILGPTDQNNYTPLVNGLYNVEVLCNVDCKSTSGDIVVQNICDFGLMIDYTSGMLQADIQSVCYGTEDIKWYRAIENATDEYFHDETTTSFTPPHNGTYYYTFECDLCFSYSEIYEVKDLCNDNSISMYYDEDNQSLSLTYECHDDAEPKFTWWRDNVELTQFEDMLTIEPIADGFYHVCQKCGENCLRICSVGEQVEGLCPEGPLTIVDESTDALLNILILIDDSGSMKRDEENIIASLESTFNDFTLNGVNVDYEIFFYFSSISYSGTYLPTTASLDIVWIADADGGYLNTSVYGKITERLVRKSHCVFITDEVFSFFSTPGNLGNEFDLCCLKSNPNMLSFSTVYYEGSVYPIPFDAGREKTYASMASEGGSISYVELYPDCSTVFTPPPCLTGPTGPIEGNNRRYYELTNGMQSIPNLSADIVETHSLTGEFSNSLEGLTVEYFWNVSSANAEILTSQPYSNTISTNGSGRYSLTVKFAKNGQTIDCDLFKTFDYAEASSSQEVDRTLSTPLDFGYENQNLTIYPNPTKNEFFIEFDSDIKEVAKVDLYNFIGQRVISQGEDINKGSVQIKIKTSHLSDGIYYGVIKKPSGNENFKIEVIR